MALTIIRDTTPGAPVLTNAIGSLIGVLDYCLVTTLGWTKPFSAANKAAYKQPAGTNGFYLRVDDTVAGNAQVRGCETMSSVDDTSVCFPTNAQIAVGSGPYIYKGTSTNPSMWTFASDGKIFHLLIAYTYNDTASYELYTFGDVRPFKSGDQFHTFLMANFGANATSISAACTALNNAVGNASGHYFARSWSQIGTAVSAGKVTDVQGLAINTYLGTGSTPFPCPIDGGMQMAPIYANEQNAGRRGLVPGIWGHGHAYNILNSRDTFAGNNDVAGRNFEYYRMASNYSVMLEISDTWG